ncbi:MAG TPA: transposase [Vicinamibacterales bacterium]|nr:transposase [Vicinamibacterales bacterium]
MPRRLRRSLDGAAFHVMNRAVRRTVLFQSNRDYEAFVRIVIESLTRFRIRPISFELMPNHWHFVVLCNWIAELSRWQHWLAGTHANRWNGAHGLRGTGAVYQGRFKAVPIQHGLSLVRACRYVERNALRKGLVARAEDWPWSSLHAVRNNCDLIPLAAWPIPRPDDWLAIVNGEEVPEDLELIRTCIMKNWPIGEPEWQRAVAPFAGLSMKPRGRKPRNR